MDTKILEKIKAGLNSINNYKIISTNKKTLMREEGELKKVRNGKYPVYYKYINNGSDETIVFLHGLFSTSSIFRHFCKFLKKNIILMELRGIAYSKCKRPYIDNYVSDIRLVLKEENITKNVILVGYSLGCTIANAFADKHENMIKKVVMLAPVNKTLKKIGKKQFTKNILKGLGNQCIQKWKEFITTRNGWSIKNGVRLFNMKLLKDAYKEMQFTNKAKIIILTGKKDTFFDAKDPHLKLSNIFVEKIERMDHFMFLSRKKIESIMQALQPHLM